MIHIFDPTVLITETGVEAPPVAEIEIPPTETDLDKDQKVPISELRKVRAEAAENRKRAQKLEADLQKIKDDQEKAKKDAEFAKLEETERYKKINEDLTNQLATEKKQRERIQKESRLVNLALQMKIKAPALAIKQIDSVTLDMADPTDDQALTGLLQSVIDENAKFGIPIVMTETPPATNVQTPPRGGAFSPANPNSPPKPKLVESQQLDQLKREAANAYAAGDIAKGNELEIKIRQDMNRQREVQKGLPDE